VSETKCVGKERRRKGRINEDETKEKQIYTREIEW